MPRIAEPRPPAAPASAPQSRRRRRILDAAAELGDNAELEPVQMLDVAKSAGVAIATLYRYFPSKTHLFAAVFDDKIARFVAEEWVYAGDDPTAQVGKNLVALNRHLLKTPRLCAAMLGASAVGYMTDASLESLWLEANSALPGAIFATLGIANASDRHRRAIMLLIYSWWGVLASTLSHRTTQTLAAQDLQLAASSLLSPARNRARRRAVAPRE